MTIDIKLDDIIEGCNLHLGTVVYINYDEDTVRHRSLFNGQEYNCSLNYCGVYVVPPREIEMKTKIWETEGIEGLSKRWNSQFKKPNDE